MFLSAMQLDTGAVAPHDATVLEFCKMTNTSVKAGAPPFSLGVAGSTGVVAMSDEDTGILIATRPSIASWCP